MKAVVVTTFNKEGYALYGKRMIETYLEYWRCNVPMVVYYENWDPRLKADNLEYVELLKSSTWLNDFKRRNRHKSRTNYRHDAVRFSHKIAAVIATARSKALDYLIWADGDILTHMPFDLPALQTLLPSRNQLIAWLDRSKTYPECGFFILNCGHKDYWKFIDGLEELYATDKIYELAEWTDCHAIEQMIMILQAETKSLSGNIGQHSNHPFVNGPLGRWFDHLKGNRKRMGRTPTGDLMRQREEPYWRNRRW